MTLEQVKCISRLKHVENNFRKFSIILSIEEELYILLLFLKVDLNRVPMCHPKGNKENFLQNLYLVGYIMLKGNLIFDLMK